MFHIFLDFEMNPISKSHKEARTITYNEIVEIGAVKLDENYHQVGRFSCYVRPELNIIMKKITELTSITQANVEGAPTLSVALDKFSAWIGQDPVKIYSWSDCDKIQLMSECRLKNIKVPHQFHCWMDFQRVYTHLMGLSGSCCLSLKNAMGSVDKIFQGEQHRAVYDAENAASLLTLVKNKEDFQKRTQIISNVFYAPKPAVTTLGDLFADTFAKLRLQTA